MLGSEGEKNIGLLLQPTLPDLDQMTCRRISRTIQSLVRAIRSNDKRAQRMFGVAVNGNTNQLTNEKDRGLTAFVTHFHNINLLFDGTINHCHYLVFSTVTPNNDVFTLSQMLKLDDIKNFVLAMLKEIEDHESRDHWELIERKDLPAGVKTILSVWAVKKKKASRWTGVQAQG